MAAPRRPGRLVSPSRARRGDAPGARRTAGNRPTKGLRVRPITLADREAWIALRRELWPDHTAEYLANDADAVLRSRRHHRLWRASMRMTVLLAEVGPGRIVGFAEVDLRPFADGCRTSPVGYLEGWYVKAEFRRKGVGRALVRAAEDWARDQGCKEMASDTELRNLASQGAHRALRYTEVDRLVHFRRDLGASPP